MPHPKESGWVIRMECEICLKQTSHTCGGICGDCYRATTGKSINNNAYEYVIKTKDNITLWMAYVTEYKLGPIAGWVDGRVIPKEILNPRDAIEVVEYIRAIKEEQGSYNICSTCAKPSEIVDSQFAGQYCEECWERHKKTNSGHCCICGKPNWRCYC